MTCMNSILSRLIPLTVALAGGLSGCSIERQPTPPAPETVRNVAVLPVRRPICLICWNRWEQYARRRLANSQAK